MRKSKKKVAKPPRVPNERLDAVPAPNHRASMFIWPEDYVGVKSLPDRIFKLLSLVRPSAEADDGGLLFADDKYGLKKWADRLDCPPTWMDPEIFIRWALKDQQVVRIVKTYIKQRTSKNDRLLCKQLIALFDTLYIPYVQTQFAAAVPVLAAWLRAYMVDKLQNKDVYSAPKKLPSPGEFKRLKAKKRRGAG